MSTPDDKRLDPFIDWLDALVTGKSTPDIEALADPELSDICAAASQFHGLDRRLGQYADSVSPRTTSWEEVMSAHTPVLVAPGHGNINQVASRSPIAPLANPRVWERIASVLLVASIVLAVSIGLWRASGEFGFGGGNEPPAEPSIPFGGNVIQDDSGNVDPADLPIAEDCTVEPLTVDEVLWYVQDPSEAFYSSDIASPGPMPTEFVSATPPATNPPNYVPGNASQEVLDAAAETQYMLTACVLADSYFQVWALLDPWTVRDIVEYALPTLTGEDEARAILEDLEANGPSDAEEGGMPGSGKFSSMANAAVFTAPSSQGIWMLDTDPANSWQNAETLLTAGVTTYNQDGTLAYAPPSIFEARLGTPVVPDSNGMIEHFGCSFEFTWNEARQVWLVSSGPTCMG